MRFCSYCARPFLPRGEETFCYKCKKYKRGSLCKVCGYRFKRKNKHQKFCSSKCQQKNSYQKNQTAWFTLRFKILQRDNFTCQYCGRTPQDNCKLQVDHINPKANGGNNDINNLITSCIECNLGKGDILLSQRQEEKLTERIKQSNKVTNNDETLQTLPRLP